MSLGGMVCGAIASGLWIAWAEGAFGYPGQPPKWWRKRCQHRRRTGTESEPVETVMGTVRVTTWHCDDCAAWGREARRP